MDGKGIESQEELAEIVVGWGIEEITAGIGTPASMHLTSVLDNCLRELESINRKLNHPDVPQGKKEKLRYRQGVLERKKRELAKM